MLYRSIFSICRGLQWGIQEGEKCCFFLSRKRSYYWLWLSQLPQLLGSQKGTCTADEIITALNLNLKQMEFLSGYWHKWNQYFHVHRKTWVEGRIGQYVPNLACDRGRYRCWFPTLCQNKIVQALEKCWKSQYWWPTIWRYCFRIKWHHWRLPLIKVMVLEIT